MPPGSEEKALAAAVFRPSTSTMSTEGAPRGKDIVSATSKRLRGCGREVHVDDRAVAALVAAQLHLSHSRQRRQRLLEPADGLGAGKRARGHGQRADILAAGGGRRGAPSLGQGPPVV